MAIKESAAFCELIFKTQNQFSLSKNRFYFLENNSLFIFWGRQTTFKKKSCFANFKFGGTLFSKIMSNYGRPHVISIHKMQQFP